MNANQIFTSIISLKETLSPIEIFNQHVGDIFTDTLTYFKRQITSSAANCQFYYSPNPQTPLNVRVYCPIFYKNILLMSVSQQSKIYGSYAKQFCKFLKPSSLTVGCHIFHDGGAIIFIATKNKRLYSIFKDYLTIRIGCSPPPNDKDSFILDIEFGGPLSRMNVIKPYNNIDKEIADNLDLLPILRHELRDTISYTAKAIRFTPVDTL